MKRWIVGFLLISLLTGTTCVMEFFKIPFLISHYYDHKELSGSISFGAYLLLHYVNDAHEKQDNDYREDHQLPFKTHEVVQIQIAPLANNLHFSFISECSNFDYNNYKEMRLPLETGSDFWNPPRV